MAVFLKESSFDSSIRGNLIKLDKMLVYTWYICIFTKKTFKNYVVLLLKIVSLLDIFLAFCNSLKLTVSSSLELVNNDILLLKF